MDVKLATLNYKNVEVRIIYLHLDKQRYYCRNCNQYSTAETSITKGKSTISLELKREVIYRLTLEHLENLSLENVI